MRRNITSIGFSHTHWIFTTNKVLIWSVRMLKNAYKTPKAVFCGLYNVYVNDLIYTLSIRFSEFFFIFFYVKQNSINLKTTIVWIFALFRKKQEFDWIWQLPRNRNKRTKYTRKIIVSNNTHTPTNKFKWCVLLFDGKKQKKDTKI